MRHSDTSIFGMLTHLAYTFKANRTYCRLKVKYLHNDQSQAVVHRNAEKDYEGLVVFCEKCVAAKPIIELGAIDL